MINDASNFLIKTNLSIANLNEFHILLQNFLYAMILFMLRLMLVPWTMYANKPNLKASEPHSEIPCGNSCFNFLTEVSCYPFDKLLSLIFLIKLSRLVPSMIYKGSITLPLVLDILFPSLSQTIGWSKTSLKGALSVSQNDIMTILATQKNKISLPVYNIWFGKKAL